MFLLISEIIALRFLALPAQADYYHLVRCETAICERIELIGDRVRVHFQSDLVPASGQCLLARAAETADPYLRRALYPSLLGEAGFAVDLARGDPLLQHLAPGAAADLLGPVGRGLPDLPARTRLLLIAESDPGPLLPLAARAIDRAGTATLLLRERYPLDALQPELEVRVGDLAGLAGEYASAADQAYLYGSRRLGRSLYQALLKGRPVLSSDFAYILIPQDMPCGVGACGACSLRTTRGHQPACLSGPFFSLADLEIG